MKFLSKEILLIVLFMFQAIVFPFSYFNPLLVQFVNGFELPLCKENKIAAVMFYVHLPKESVNTFKEYVTKEEKKSENLGSIFLSHTI